MYQYDHATAVAARPARGSAGTAGWFTDGDAGVNLPPTVLVANFLNMLQAELLAVLTAGAVTPSKTNDAQLLAAMQALFLAKTAKAADSELLDGLDSTAFVRRDVYPGAAPIYAVRAWCEFVEASDGAITLIGGGNVASVTRNARNDYTLTFDADMPSAGYGLHVTAAQLDPSQSGPSATMTGGLHISAGTPSLKSAHAVRVQISDNNADATIVAARVSVSIIC
ncbi:hypothetical protein [Derxia gummosa]|uniref:Uncharacterized protein n=1 Tax=Derxia gummosa DSM 723 TaxID=1121388 RepID=A0A8B6X7T3_9BURK|nr:hypothetical protein [Derxia gummosa]